MKMMTPSTHRVRADAQVASRCMQTRIFPRIYQWLFFAIAIQLQPHGGKNHIVLYQETWLRRRLHASKLLSAATSHGSTGEVPVLEHETFSRTVLGTPRVCCKVVAESSLLTCSRLCSHISWYNTIWFLPPCGCS